jgi:hypothetical protein
VHQAERRSREQLHAPEECVNAPRRRVPEDQWLAVISVKPTTRPMSGATTMKISVFVQPRR